MVVRYNASTPNGLPAHVKHFISSKFKTDNNNNNNEKFILRRKMQKQTQMTRSLHIGKTHDQHLEACCRGISSCKAGDNPKLPLSHLHCYQYLNGAKLLLSNLHNDDSRCMTGWCSLTSYPGQVQLDVAFFTWFVARLGRPSPYVSFFSCSFHFSDQP